MLRISLLISLTAALSMQIAAAADVYKYTDEKGKVQYTDKPLKLPAERLNVQSQRTDVVAMEERRSEDSKDVVGQDKARETAEKTEALKRETAAANEANKADACKKATSDYLARMGTGRIYEMQPNGERRYLDGAEVDASRNAAKQTMDALCN